MTSINQHEFKAMVEHFNLQPLNSSSQLFSLDKNFQIHYFEDEFGEGVRVEHKLENTGGIQTISRKMVSMYHKLLGSSYTKEVVYESPSHAHTPPTLKFYSLRGIVAFIAEQRQCLNKDMLDFALTAINAKVYTNIRNQMYSRLPNYTLCDCKFDVALMKRFINTVLPEQYNPECWWKYNPADKTLSFDQYGISIAIFDEEPYTGIACSWKTQNYYYQVNSRQYELRTNWGKNFKGADYGKFVTTSFLPWATTNIEHGQIMLGSPEGTCEHHGYINVMLQKAIDAIETRACPKFLNNL